jgi:hypothetical protein
MRLSVESEAMRRHWPGFRLMRLRTGSLAWRGRVRLDGGPGYLVSAELPAHYPYEAPVLRVLAPRLVDGCPHRYAAGDLCVHVSGWQPQSGTVIQAVANAVDWLRHYQGWRRTGVWRA